MPAQKHEAARTVEVGGGGPSAAQAGGPAGITPPVHLWGIAAQSSRVSFAGGAQQPDQSANSPAVVRAQQRGGVAQRSV
jgi:hypothetical protein